MEKNPFKFGTVVDDEFFTDREEEIRRIKSFIKGENHMILISPRRYGKTSLVRKVLNESNRKHIYLDLQLVFSADDFAAQLLKRVYRIFPVQKMKGFVKSFRLIPSVIMNPVTGETEISFKPGSKNMAPVEDVLNLIEKLGSKDNKIILVLDEFQEIFRIDNGLERLLRSVMQNHKNINYIFMGSSESMIRDIFERKSSPFYRFGSLMTLEKIPAPEFNLFLEERLSGVTESYKDLVKSIMEITDFHPFYTQQLAFTVWEILNHSGYSNEITELAADEIVQSHDNDYERIWNSLNRTDMSVLAGMCSTNISPLSDEFSKLFGTGASSTVFSALKRLAGKGLLVREKSRYTIDDPFFRRWIITRRKI